MPAKQHCTSLDSTTKRVLTHGKVVALYARLWQCTLALVLVFVVPQALAIELPVGDEPVVVAINTVTHQAALVEEDSRDLRIVDLSAPSVLEIIPLNVRPTEIALNPSTNTVVVTQKENKTATIVDLVTGDTLAVIGVGRGPDAVAVDTDRNIAVVANEKDDSVTLIDLKVFSVIATISVGKRPDHVAVDSRAGIAVVSNEKDDTMSLIDLHTHALSGTVPVPEAPGSIAVNPNTDYAVIAHEKLNEISVINLAAGSVVATLRVGRSPVAVAINPVTNRAVVVNRKEDSLTLVDLATITIVGKLRVGRDPIGVAVDPAENLVAVANEKSESVSLIDLDNVIFWAPAPAGRDPRGVAIHPQKRLAVVANEKSNSATVIGLPSGSVISTVPVGRSPYDVAVDSWRNIAAITLKKDDRVAFVDLANDLLLGSLNVGKEPHGIAVDSQSGIAVVANSRSDTLTVIDMNAQVVTATVPTGSEPGSVALQMPEARAWVTMEREDTVQVIDLASHAIIATVPVGENPSGIAISPKWGLAAVANEKDDSLTLIDLGTLSTVAVVAVGREPRGVAIDDFSGRAYVANRRSNTVSVVDLDTQTVIDSLPTGRHPEQVSVDGANLVGIVTNEGSDDVTVLTLPDTIPPKITVDFPPDGHLTNQPRLIINGAVSEPAHLTINSESVALESDHSFSHVVSLQEGTNTLSLEATDNAGNSSSISVTVVLDTTPPTAPVPGLITVSDVINGEVTVAGAPGSIDAGTLVTVTNTRTQETITVVAGADGSFTAHITALPGDGVVIFAMDSAGNGSDSAKVFVGGLPPDPATVAPPLDPTVATNMYDSTAFLYSGPYPIQTGVASGAITQKRAAVMRGMAMDRDGNPISGVTITIRNHPEYGQTLTRTDGMFDMVVNGGGDYVVEYKKDGYLRVQRRINVPWQDFALLPDVILIHADPDVKTVDLNSNNPMQVVQGGIVTDNDGARRATLMFPQGTQADMVLPDGSIQSLSTLNVRATEYTVGDNGGETMPAELPSTSGYTYAVEFSVDEALAVNAKDVRFSQPVYAYVDNFLGFQAGTIVPAGYYDRDAASWIPSDNGRVIEILGISNGLAELDVDGSGQPADLATLATLGITDFERQELANTYSPGASLWRVAIMHFTPWDFNWPYGPPVDAKRPDPPKAGSNDADKLDDPNCQKRSIIECENMILGESVAIAGTPYSLHYRSDRTPGRKAANILTIPLSGDTVPASLTGIELEISIAGRRFKKNFPAAPSQITTFTWDGKDAYGRGMQGLQRATIHIDYVYALSLYFSPDDFFKSFSLTGISPLQTYLRKDVRLGETQYVNLAPQGGGAWDGRAQGLGGWSLNIQHVYDPIAQVLYLGDGSRRTARIPFLNLNQIVSAVAGDGTFGFGGDGGQATNAQLAEPDGVAVAPDGGIFFADFSNNRIRRVAPDGTISTVAGNGVAGFSGDGGPAVQAQLNHPTSIAVTTDGEVYISDSYNNRIRFVDETGVIHTMVGSGVAPPDISNLKSGCANLNGGPRGPLVGDPDGCPATEFDLFHRPGAVARGHDGSLYFTLPDENRLYRVGPDGTITILAGTGDYGFNGDDMPARQTWLASPRALVVSSDGDIIFSDTENNRVRRIGADGFIHTVAGTGNSSFSGDGAQATSAALNYPTGLAIGPDNGLYLLDSGNFRIRRIGQDGIINTYAGRGTVGTFSNGELIGHAQLDYAASIAFGPDGDLYIPQPSQNRIYQVVQALRRFDNKKISIPSDDGNEIYEFDASGRHLQTVNAYSGAILYKFVYNSDGYLTQIVDGDGNRTNIERSAGNVPSAIVSPDGVQTTLSVDQNGYLNTIINPDGDVSSATYSQDGLLQTFTDPRGNSSHFQFNGVGQLIRDEDAAGGFWNLEKIDLSRGRRVNLTSSEGYITSYILDEISPLASPVSGQLRDVIHSDGGRTETKSYNDGSKLVNTRDGTVVTTHIASDPRLGILAPIISSTSVTSPAGLSLNISRTRTIVPASDLVIDDTANVNGRVFDRHFDVRNMTITYTTPEGHQIVTTVDDKFRPLSVQVAGMDSVSYGRDIRGRLTSISQGGRSATFDYDSNGFLHRVTDPLGRSANYDYDSAGRLTRKTLPDGRIVYITYDANGDVTSIQPPGRDAHVFTYNAVNQEQDYTPPSISTGSSVTQYSYNLDKQLTGVTRPDGKVVGYSYDNAGRLSSVVLPRGQVTYGYNHAGQLSQIDAPGNNMLNYIYDGVLPVSESWSGTVSGSVARSYNENFQLTWLSVDGAGVAFSYDLDGLLTQAGTLSINRNAQNGLISGTGLGGVSTGRGYSSFGELASETASYDGGDLYSETLVHDALGRITTKEETVAGVTTTYNYSYDMAGRLSSVQTNNTTTASYSYDANGNRIGGQNIQGNIGASYDAQDRLISYNGAKYTYTTNGDLLTETDAGQTTSYTYDVLGNLTDVTLPDGTAIKYVVDGRNRRVGKTVNGMLVQGFLYRDQLNPIAELDGSGNVVSRFIYGTRSNVPDYMIKGGVTYRIISDHLGSPRLVVNASDGSIVQRLDYDEFGNITKDTNPGFQPFGFAGGINDSDTRLTHIGARDYDAETGRWTVKDPILFGGHDTNIYVYVENDPITYIDPRGLLIGSLFSKFLGHIFGRTPEEAAAGGRILDVVIGAVANEVPISNCVRGVDVGTPLDVLEGAGGVQAIGLSTTTTIGIYGTGATVGSISASAVLPVSLAAYGGFTAGSAINRLYEQLRGGAGSIGTDIYTLLH